LTVEQHASLIAEQMSKLMAVRPASTKPRTPVILFPAIDLKDGQCVRLKLGDMAAVTVFNEDPAAQAKLFETQGFRYLHVVDLDGAFAGRPVNRASVRAILKAVRIPLQLGGGIRSLASIEAWLAEGVARVILGTIAVRDPGLVKEACRRFPGRIAVGVDAKEGTVAVEGWAMTSELSVLDLARRFEDTGVAAMIHTDIARDGVLKGLNLAATAALARATRIPTVASGGLAGIEDVEALLRPEYAILEGAIGGRALYDGRLDAPTALSLIRRAERANP
jgi:phosphoribosylformimino-5-aminoimidazole carboxamide ribotide isomerase